MIKNYSNILVFALTCSALTVIAQPIFDYEETKKNNNLEQQPTTLNRQVSEEVRYGCLLVKLAPVVNKKRCSLPSRGSQHNLQEPLPSPTKKIHPAPTKS